MLKCDIEMVLLSPHQTYREELADFRNTVLPRDVSRNFRENPETNLIRDHRTATNDRYDRLRVGVSDFTSHLSSLLEKHRLYNNNLSSTSIWLDDCRLRLDRCLEEPISSEPINIQRQIEELKVRKELIVKLRGKKKGKNQRFGRGGKVGAYDGMKHNN